VLGAYDLDAASERILFDPSLHSRGKAPTALRSRCTVTNGRPARCDLAQRRAGSLAPPHSTGTATTSYPRFAAEGIADVFPDGKRVAFVRNGNLYAVEIKSGRVKRLTVDGSDTILNVGSTGSTAKSSAASAHGSFLRMVADSRQIVFLRLDQRAVPDTHHDFLPRIRPSRDNAIQGRRRQRPPALCVVDVASAVRA